MPLDSADIAILHRSPRRWFPWLLGIIVLVSVGGYWLGYKPPVAPPEPWQPVPVSDVVAISGTLDTTLSALGTVTPLATVAVKPEVSGKLTQIAYREGQMVKAGDFLAEIDPRPYRSALLQAQGQLRRDQALLDNAKLDLRRYRSLLDEDSVAQQRFDTQAALVREYDGSVTMDRAAVTTAQINLDYCHMVAPVSGRIGLRLVDLGNYVTSGLATGIIVITQLQPISVVFPVAEDYLPAIMHRLLQGEILPVTAYNRNGGTVLARGKLVTIDNQVDPTTGTVRFKAEFANHDLSLFPNQFVNARLVIETSKQATLVPTVSVQFGPEGPFVYVIKKGGIAAMTPIKLGQADGDNTAVLSGLAPGTPIVLAGADRLRDGSRVHVEETAMIKQTISQPSQ